MKRFKSVLHLRINYRRDKLQKILSTGFCEIRLTFTTAEKRICNPFTRLVIFCEKKKIHRDVKSYFTRCKW